MRPLPPETLHDPVEAGPYRMAMGLVTVPQSAWFEFDTLYPAEIAARRALLRDQHDAVFGALPRAEQASAEALELILAHLAVHHHDWFTRSGDRLHNRLTDEILYLGDPRLHPLELAGRLVQEDLCLIQDSPEGPVFTAGVLCFPSRWRLADKLGHPLAAVHGPVPIYAERLAAPVDRFMRQIRPGRIAGRLNWSVVDDPALFQPTGKWQSAQNDAVTEDNAGETLFLRVERQTLRRLPISGAILFGIRVHVRALDRYVTSPEIASRLASAVRALPDDIARYKSFPSIQTALLAWLDRRAA